MLKESLNSINNTIENSNASKTEFNLAIIDTFQEITVLICDLDYSNRDNQLLFISYLDVIDNLSKECTYQIYLLIDNIVTIIRNNEGDGNLDFVNYLKDSYNEHINDKVAFIKSFTELYVINDQNLPLLLDKYYEIMYKLLFLYDNFETGIENIVFYTQLLSNEFYSEIYEFLTNNFNYNMNIKSSTIKYCNILSSYKQKKCGDNILAHYTNISSLYNIFKGKKLWISDINYMNDSQEIKTYFKYLNENIKIYLTSNSDTQFNLFIKNNLLEPISKIANDSYAILPSEFKKKYSLPHSIYVLSLSKNTDSLFLWSNYGSSYTGLNFQIMENAYINTLKNNLTKRNCSYDYFISKEVNYINPLLTDLGDSNIEKIKSIYLNASQNIETLNIKNLYEFICSKVLMFFLKKAIFTKNLCFNPENEFRIAFLNDDYTEKMCHRANDLTIIPYIEVNIDDIKDITKKITIGPINNSQTIKLGLNSYLNSKPASILEINKTEISNSELPIRE